MKTTKRIISISLALIMTLTLGVSLITVAAVNAPLEQVANNKSLNLIAVQNVGSVGESVLVNNPPLEVELVYNEELDKTLCKLTLKSNYGIDSAKITVVTTNRDQNDTLYNDTVFAGETFEFYTNRTENIVSIDCNDCIYVGSFLVYDNPITCEVPLYDLWMNKMNKTTASINLDAYSNLSAIQSRQFSTQSTVELDSILSNDNTQILYSESMSNTAVYKFAITKGGYGIINFTSADENAQYRIDVYYDRKYYDDTKKDVLIHSFEVTGSANNLPVFLNNGHKYIKITRMDKMNNKNAYAITINNLEWSGFNDNISRADTSGNWITLSGDPLDFNQSLWSDPGYAKMANCYAYVLNTPVTSVNYPSGSFASLNVGDWANWDIDDVLASADSLEAALTADAKADDGNASTGTVIFKRVNGLRDVPDGTYRIAIVYDLADDLDNPDLINDYHFYRQNNYITNSSVVLPNKASWSHKFSGTLPQYFDDTSEDVIYNPYYCDRSLYPEWLGHAYVASNP